MLSQRVVAASIGALVVLGGCNQAVVYEAGSLTPTASGDCARPEISSAIVSILNRKVGLPDGPLASISGTQLSTIENGAIDMNGPTLTCRGYLQSSNGQIGPGKVAVRFSYGSRSAPEDAKWLSEDDERRAEVAFRSPVRYDPHGPTAPQQSSKPPKWILRSTVNGLSDYLDVDNIRRNGSVVSIWHLQNFSTPLGESGDSNPVCIRRASSRGTGQNSITLDPRS